jgi:hypothetical protein
MPSNYLPGTIGIFNSDYSKYVDLYPVTNLTSAGGTVDIASGFDCPTCGVLLDNADHQPKVIGAAATPEPSALPFLGAGVIGMVIVLCRKLVRAS